MQVYDTARARHLLAGLQAQAFEVLMFLKGLESLELLEWDAGASEPRVIFTCHVQVSVPRPSLPCVLLPPWSGFLKEVCTIICQMCV
jgi:hypothetical protein